MAPAATSRILVRLPNWLGDAIMARPLLAALRAAHRPASILAVGSAAFLDLLEPDGAFDERVTWGRDARSRSDATRRARDVRPAAAVVLPASFSSALLAWRSGARVRVGFRGDARAALLTHALARRPRGERHLSEEFLELGAVLGATEVSLPPLRPRAGAIAQADALCADVGMAAGAPLALLGPRSAFGPAREWPAPRFAEVGRDLASRGWTVLVCGTAAERETCEQVARSIGAGGIAIAGRTDLPALAALAARARLAVCNDSGLAHLAAACGTPTLQIYGSASSAWTAARGAHVRVLHRAPVCSPCWQRRCRIGTLCLDAISVRLVLDAADTLLEGAA